MKKEVSKKRDCGIELLRIILMIMILILHFCEKPGFDAIDYFDKKIQYTCWVLEAFCIVAVNCFVLITGYFLIKSECKIKKVIKLWKQVLFYTLTFLLIFKFFLKREILIEDTLKSFLPITLKTYWFISTYVVLYLLAPYLNKCIENIDKRFFKRLISILLIISCVSSLLVSFGFSVIDSSNGYGILWFVTLYCIGAYIRLHGKANKEKYCFIKYVTLSILIFSSKIILLKLIEKGIIKDGINTGALYKYNSITVLLSSVYLFLFFKNLDIRWKSLEKIVLNISPLVLAIYIIHENPLIRSILYKEILYTQDIYYLKGFLILMVIYCISMFIICCVIEVLRLNIFNCVEKIKNRALLKHEEEL